MDKLTDLYECPVCLLFKVKSTTFYDLADSIEQRDEVGTKHITFFKCSRTHEWKITWEWKQPKSA